MGVLVVTPLLFPSLPPSRLVFPPPSFPSLTPYSFFSVPSCKSLGNNITNGTVQYSTERSEEGRHIVDTTITVNCNNGYGPGGVITCESSGNWSDDLPHCDCEFMSTSIHAHSYSSYSKYMPTLIPLIQKMQGNIALSGLNT